MTVSKELMQDLNISSMSLSYFDFEYYKKTGEDSFGLIPCILTKYDDGKLSFKLLKNSKIDPTDVDLQISIKESVLPKMNLDFFIKANKVV